MQRSADVPATTSTNPELAWLGEARHRGFLGRLPDRIVALVVRSAQRVEYAEGTVGLRWDQEPKAAFVLAGTLRAYISSPEGTQVTTRYLRAGDMTGVNAPKEPVLARGVQALERSELLFIDRTRIKELSQTEPNFAWALIQELTTVIVQTQRALHIRAFGSVRQRVVSAIVDRATASGHFAVGSRVPGTQQDLATAVGSVREVVASTLGAMKHEGLIDVRRGAIIVLDPGRLAREAAAILGEAR
jgi:CRP/FNR family transcriptional regulator, cyclic AMP receptor protein